MIRTILVAVMGLCLVGVCGAQNAADTNGAPSEIKQNKLELRTVVGCLSKTTNTYVITGGGPGPKQFRIVGGNTSLLEGKIGHTFKVVGMVGKNDAVENMITPYNEGSTTGVGYNTIVAQETKEVYANCSEPGNEYAGDHK
jgi:hypothetical protein